MPRLTPKCRACQVKVGGYSRGLCRLCYADPGTRERFPPQESDFRPYSEPLVTTLPEKATRALPGTPAKVLVLMARAAARTQLFHPNDPFM